MEEGRNQFVEQQKNQNVEQQRQNSTNIPMEATVEDAQHVTIREQSVDGMMIPNANRQKEYRKRNLTELTAQEWEEQRKRNVDRQREYQERRSKQENNL